MKRARPMDYVAGLTYGYRAVYDAMDRIEGRLRRGNLTDRIRRYIAEDLMVIRDTMRGLEEYPTMPDIVAAFLDRVAKANEGAEQCAG